MSSSRLLALAIDAHGGLERWNELTSVDGRFIIGGAIWGFKGVPDVLADITVALDLHTERVTLDPVAGPDTHTVFADGRLQLLSATGDGRRDGRRSEGRDGTAGLRRPVERDGRRILRQRSVVDLPHRAIPVHLPRVSRRGGRALHRGRCRLSHVEGRLSPTTSTATPPSSSSTSTTTACCSGTPTPSTSSTAPRARTTRASTRPSTASPFPPFAASTATTRTARRSPNPCWSPSTSTTCISGNFQDVFASGSAHSAPAARSASRMPEARSRVATSSSGSSL